MNCCRRQVECLAVLLTKWEVLQQADLFHAVVNLFPMCRTNGRVGVGMLPKLLGRGIEAVEDVLESPAGVQCWPFTKNFVAPIFVL